MILHVLLFLSSLALANTSANSTVNSTSSVLGHWKFEEIIYQGNRVPRPDPSLYLTWTFYQNGTARLYWDRGGADFCERFSHYQIQQDFLSEKVFSVNPANGANCASDPDMQVGASSKVRITVLEDEVLLHIPISNEELTYVLKKENL